MVQLKLHPDLFQRACIARFNSCMVQLKFVRRADHTDTDVGFNSCMVQLKS